MKQTTKSRRGCAHPRFKHGRHCVNFPSLIGVAVCPKYRRKHGTPAERERRERVLSAKFLSGLAMGGDYGYREGYHDGFNAGQDAAFKAAARRSRD